MFTFSLVGGVLFSQVSVPDDIDSTGHPQNKRMGIHNANQVRTMFYNQGEVGEWKHPLSGEWPRGSGHTYLDGNALIVAAAAVDENGNPILNIEGNPIHPVETMYRECIRPVYQCAPTPPGEFGWQPLPGYFNLYQDPLKESQIAMSDQPDTWPDEWPDRPDWVDLETGLAVWNGYFGRGITNADQESYSVMDDDYDEQFKYYPDATDSTRRGLGLRVAVRGLQWVHVLAEDVIFWHYEITNVATVDYDSVYFGMYFDTGIGGEGDSDDDDAHYDKLSDITYVSDKDEKSVNWPGKPGWVGYAFLESPGIGDVFDENGALITQGDGTDNDDDGLVDESRSNDGGEWVDASVGVADVEKFVAFYGRQPRPHWAGDEDQDWDSFEDLDGNGVWDSGEPLNDDVGADGSGPLDADYPGPDEGEGDGRPTMGEPDFGKVDKDESDQIGLTSVFADATHTVDLFEHEKIWELFAGNTFQADYVGGINTAIYYGSGPFPLKGKEPGEQVGQTERFSMALIFGDSEQDLLRNRRTVQAIYNANYNFSKPPLKPTVTAIPGDKKVTLYWDDVAEQSYDKFLERYDFEGYMILKSTENTFHEVYEITDAYGSPKYYKSVVQFDLDNGISGLHPADVDGVKFNLGDDTGLVHSWIDTNVFNGQTYYYAVVSYDQGDTLLGSEMIVTEDGDTVIISQEGLAPTTSSARIERDVSGNIWTDVNTVAVTPNAPAAGHIPAETGDIIHLPWAYGTGRLEVRIIDPRLIESATYQVTFQDDSTLKHNTIDYSVTHDGDTIISRNQEITGREGPFFDGMSLYIHNDTKYEIIDSLSGWTEESDCNFGVRFGTDYSNPSRRQIYPTDYEVRFFDAIVDTSYSGFPEHKIQTNFQVWDVTDPESEKVPFYFYDGDTSGAISIGDALIPYKPNPGSGSPRRWPSWKIDFSTPDDVSTQLIEPQSGDLLKIEVTKPFRSGDVFEFTTSPASVSEELATDELDQIAVVPNPYVATAIWEPNPPYAGYQGRYQRKIDFIHLPQTATIRIYTTRGHLVKTIEHNSGIDDGSASWNLVSKDGMDVAFGIYIYHVSAPGVGEKVGKFAVIK
jgi:hypothetical protein